MKFSFFQWSSSSSTRCIDKSSNSRNGRLRWQKAYWGICSSWTLLAIVGVLSTHWKRWLDYRTSCIWSSVSVELLLNSLCLHVSREPVFLLIQSRKQMMKRGLRVRMWFGRMVKSRRETIWTMVVIVNRGGERSGRGPVKMRFPASRMFRDWVRDMKFCWEADRSRCEEVLPECVVLIDSFSEFLLVRENLFNKYNELRSPSCPQVIGV